MSLAHTLLLYKLRRFEFPWLEPFRGRLLKHLSPDAFQLALLFVLLIRSEGLLLRIDVLEASGVGGTYVVRCILLLQLFLLAFAWAVGIAIRIGIFPFLNSF